jgi:hypothetical protein
LTSNGGIKTDKVNIKDFKPLNNLAGTLKIDILKNPALNNINSQFEIKQGRMFLKPFDILIDDIKINIKGSNGIDHSINYSLIVDVPTSRLNLESSGILGELFPNDSQLSNIEKIPIDVAIGGTIDNPTLNTNISDVTKKLLENELKNQTKDLKDEAKKKLFDLFKKN